MREPTRLTDHLAQASGYGRGHHGPVTVTGLVVATLHRPDGTLRDRIVVPNLVTQVGDQYYGERAAGIASPPAQVTGMQLGTGTTAPAKTGAGAAIVTYQAGSDKAIDGAFPQSSLQGSSRRISWRAVWAAGEATANGLAEVAIVNRTLDASVATEAQTIARALLSPVVNKGASDTLTVDWHHDLLGA